MTPSVVKGLASVIIPVYNAASYLGAAVKSVLDQTYSPLEIIVVNDGSTDGSAEVAKGFDGRVKYACQDRGGIGAARNLGISMAEGEFYAFLDADDLWTDTKLELQVSVFRENPSLDLVFGLVAEFVEEPGAGKSGGRNPRHRPGILAGTAMVRRDAFHRVGLFSTEVRVGEFLDWYARAGEAGLSMEVLPELVLHRRIHGENQGIRSRKHLADYARVLKASLDRRRAGGKLPP